jgi:hypothetical protein
MVFLTLLYIYFSEKEYVWLAAVCVVIEAICYLPNSFHMLEKGYLNLKKKENQVSKINPPKLDYKE